MPRDRWSDLDIILGYGFVPLFPIDSFTPLSGCPHKRPIDEDSAFVCMVCSGSGVDKHPVMKMRATDPQPDTPAIPVASASSADDVEGDRPAASPSAPAGRGKSKSPTRREKRAAKYGRKPAEV